MGKGENNLANKEVPADHFMGVKTSTISGHHKDIKVSPPFWPKSSHSLFQGLGQGGGVGGGGEGGGEVSGL